METRHLKDFTVAVVVIILFAFFLKALSVYNSAQAIPTDSIYKDMAIDEQLLEQIQQIEHSIRDRMDFVFTVTRDPLEQNLVVRTKVDLEMEWRRKVEAMMRLAATYVDERGNRKAAIAYQGKTEIYSIGDFIENNKIVDIETGQITLLYQGRENILEVKPLPPKPAMIDNRTREQEYSW